MPALSAPDLQCIRAGYSISLNNFSALKIISFSGAALDLALKSTNLILYFLHASFSNNQPPSFLTPLKLTIVFIPISLYFLILIGVGILLL